MDSSILPTRFPDIFQVSTTDFFFPLVEDPFLQGQIACANVLSDLYAVGVVYCDNLLMLIGVCDGMSLSEQNITTEKFMQGFTATAKLAQTRVTGGQTVINAWPLIGGVAMSVVKAAEIIYPHNALPDDYIVLTKPLGTQVAVNLHQWMENEKWDRVKDFLTKEDAVEAYNKACKSMSRLNRTGAQLMHKYGAHAATDVTGFGIIGHATNLAQNQKASVDFIISTLPIIANMKAVDTKNQIFKLLEGKSAETSGGLLICLPSENSAKSYIEEIKRLDGADAWIVGRVVERKNGEKNSAKIAEDFTVLEI